MTLSVRKATVDDALQLRRHGDVDWWRGGAWCRAGGCSPLPFLFGHWPQESARAAGRLAGARRGTLGLCQAQLCQEPGGLWYASHDGVVCSARHHVLLAIEGRVLELDLRPTAPLTLHHAPLLWVDHERARGGLATFVPYGFRNCFMPGSHV